MQPRFRELFLATAIVVSFRAVVCLAAELSPETPKKVSEVRMNEVLPYWQQRLKLQQWNISIVVARATELRAGTLGNIEWDADKKTALIRVLDPADYRTPLSETLKDQEFTVVHELIHLELSSMPRSEASRSDEEVAINRIAQALLDGYRN